MIETPFVDSTFAQGQRLCGNTRAENDSSTQNNFTVTRANSLSWSKPETRAAFPRKSTGEFSDMKILGPAGNLNETSWLKPPNSVWYRAPNPTSTCGTKSYCSKSQNEKNAIHPEQTNNTGKVHTRRAPSYTPSRALSLEKEMNDLETTLLARTCEVATAKSRLELYRWQQQNGYQVNRLQDARKLGIFSQDLHQRKACSFQTNSIRDASKSVTYDSVRLKCSNRDPHCTNVAPMHSTNQLLTTSLPSSRRQHEAYGTRVKPAFHSSIQDFFNDENNPSVRNSRDINRTAEKGTSTLVCGSRHGSKLEEEIKGFYTELTTAVCGLSELKSTVVKLNEMLIQHFENETAKEANLLAQKDGASEIVKTKDEGVMQLMNKSKKSPAVDIVKKETTRGDLNGNSPVLCLNLENCSRSPETVSKMSAPSNKYQRRNNMKGSETVDHGETEQIIQMDQEVVKNKEESKKLERENQNLEFQAQALREQLCIADEDGERSSSPSCEKEESEAVIKMIREQEEMTAKAIKDTQQQKDEEIHALEELVKVGVEVINLKKLASELDSEALVEEESIKDLEYLKGVQEQEFTEAIETLKAAIQEKDEYLSKLEGKKLQLIQELESEKHGEVSEFPSYPTFIQEDEENDLKRRLAERKADIAAKKREYTETKAKISDAKRSVEELEKQNQECENEYKALDQKDCECEEELKKLRLEYKKILDRCEGDPLPLVTLLQEKIQQERNRAEEYAERIKELNAGRNREDKIESCEHSPLPIELEENTAFTSG